ncbi:MAG: sulfotransferase [Bacteroidales bacterium]
MKQERVITSADFMNHAKWFSTLNKVWKRTYSNGAAPLLNKDELIRTARRKSGLHDLGKDFWDEPLDRLCESYNHEARLHPIGNFITFKRLMNLLNVRLRAEHWFKEFPEILEQEVYPPTVIAGLQRTGTTKLHRLLTADPDNRVLRSWEALNPAPFKVNGTLEDKRIRIARISEKALRWMTPGFFAIHPVEHLAPEEDILLLDVSFLSTTPEATSHVPSYSSWLEKTDQSLAYAYGSKLLRLLQWQQPGRHWVLKSPHHLEFFPLIEKYYGHPHLIWTHRDPAECIPSFLSMVCHSRALFSDEVLTSQVSDHWVRKTAYMLEKALSYRQDGANHTNFTDIMYEDLVSDPMGQLEKIYERYDGISENLRQRFKRADAENPKGKYGRHGYNLSDFGLSREELIHKNRSYLNLFNTLRGPTGD